MNTEAVKAATREQIIAEARTWLDTPYHRGGRVKGAGCDCATFVFEVFYRCGLVPDENLGVFSSDWSAHEQSEVYMLRILRHARKVVEGNSYPTLQAKPGNIVLTKTESGRVYDHGGIVTAWPMLIHAMPGGVAEVNATEHWLWQYKIVKVFDPWER